MGFWLDCKNRAVILLVLSISGCHSLCPAHWTGTIWRIAQSWKTINECLSSWDDKHLVLEVIMRLSGAFMHLAEFHPKNMWTHRRQILILHKGLIKLCMLNPISSIRLCEYEPFSFPKWQFFMHYLICNSLLPKQWFLFIFTFTEQSTPSLTRFSCSAKCSVYV